MHDQADQLRKLVRQTVQADGGLAPGGAVVTLSGGRPGDGVSTIAGRLARELARLGKQVVLVNAELRRFDAPAFIHTAAGAPPSSVAPESNRGPEAGKPRGTLLDVLRGSRRAVEVLAPADEPGLRLLAACPPGAAPPLDREALERLAVEVAALGRQADVVLIDAGSGMNAWIDWLWRIARRVLLVAAAEPSALLDGYAAVKLAQYHRLDGKLRLLLNRASDESEAIALARRFDETCQRFLCIAPRAPAWLPALGLRSTEGAAPGAADDIFMRAIRMLAADLACDFRVASLRLLQPAAMRQHAP
jgi:flagellar biosynthesis protein FlhG